MAQTETFLGKLTKQRDAIGLRKMSTDSMDWFRKKVSLLGKSAFQRVMSDAQATNKMLARSPGIGFMYTFAYFAKWDETLPYWDRFPLIFIIGSYEDGFLGLNLHYLPPKLRAILLDALMAFASNKSMPTKVKINATYQTLKGFSKFDLVKPCVKRYLFSQLRSGIAKISSDEWEPAIFLPYESFVRSSNSGVWSDSIRGIRKK